MSASRISRVSEGRSRPWRGILGATLLWTWVLMVLGALTRASMAGMACPDWPLCHGYLVPPLQAAAYPQDPNYLVHKVYLEFLHRVVAAGVSLGALLIGLKAWRSGAHGLAVALGAVLGLQVAMGAVTVWAQNAPFTVVLHLMLALCFLGLLLWARRRLLPDWPRVEAPAPPRVRVGWWGLLALLTGQMLVGATVSARYFGLACTQFPFCDGGAVLPRRWSTALGWQLAHRGMGVLALLVAVLLAAAIWRAGSRAAAERRWIAACALGLLAQILVGGLNVWLRIPPWASAAHLGLAVVLFAVAAHRVVAWSAAPVGRDGGRASTGAAVP